MRIAFYAPLKAPGHATPSGDRRMGRLIVAALEAARHRLPASKTTTRMPLRAKWSAAVHPEMPPPTTAAS